MAEFGAQNLSGTKLFVGPELVTTWPTIESVKSFENFQRFCNPNFESNEVEKCASNF